MLRSRYPSTRTRDRPWRRPHSHVVLSARYKKIQEGSAPSLGLPPSSCKEGPAWTLGPPPTVGHEEKEELTGTSRQTVRETLTVAAVPVASYLPVSLQQSSTTAFLSH